MTWKFNTVVKNECIIDMGDTYHITNSLEGIYNIWNKNDTIIIGSGYNILV